MLKFYIFADNKVFSYSRIKHSSSDYFDVNLNHVAHQRFSGYGSFMKNGHRLQLKRPVRLENVVTFKQFFHILNFLEEIQLFGKSNTSTIKKVLISYLALSIQHGS